MPNSPQRITLRHPGPHRVTKNTARNMAFCCLSKGSSLRNAPDALFGGGTYRNADYGPEAPRGRSRPFSCEPMKAAGFMRFPFDRAAADKTEQRQVASRWALCHIAEAFDVSFDAVLPSWAKEQSRKSL